MIAAAIPSPPSTLLPYFGPKLAGQVLPVMTFNVQTQLPPPGDECLTAGCLASGPYRNRVLLGDMTTAIDDLRTVQMLGEGSAASTAFAVIGGALALAALGLGVVVIGSRVLKDPVLAPLPRRRDRRRGR